MPATTRDLGTPTYVGVPGQPPPLHTVATALPPSEPTRALRPGTTATGPLLRLPPVVGQVDPSDPTTWPSPDAMVFSS